MADKGLSAGVEGVLVVVALPGVQRFIEEARSTSDVAGGSGIYLKLAARVAGELGDRGGHLIFPSGFPGEHGVPNRVVALFDSAADDAVAADDGPVVAACRAVDETWRQWVRRSLRLPADEAVPDTPGFPVVQWACVPPVAGGYPEQWVRAQRLLAARRRVHDFRRFEERERDLCSLSPRWPALEEPPRGLPEHEKAALSAVGWVKRRWRFINDLEGFPSTASIASAPYRLAILERLADRELAVAVDDLRQTARRLETACPGTARGESPVPGMPDQDGGLGSWLVRAGGPWVYPDRWHAESLAREAKVPVSAVELIAADGHAAARRLGGRMSKLGAPELGAHLAVIVQDLDSMGRFLSGGARSDVGDRIQVTPESHRQVSATMQSVAAEQLRVLRGTELLGVPVYAGGDDLLAFAPAGTALRGAAACREAAEAPGSLPTSSTAVLFFHYHSGLQAALAQARDLLKQAKKRVPGKHALAVGYVRRSGASAASIQPWVHESSSTAEQFSLFSTGHEARLSPRLIADLDRDADELARLSVVSGRLYRAELTRLVHRHFGDHGHADRSRAAEIAGALAFLGDSEVAGEPGQEMTGSRPQRAARVGVFLRQEAR